MNDSGSAPAAYHLARHLEAVGRTAEAVSFYARSSRFNHAIRLAKDHGMDSEVLLEAQKRTQKPVIFMLWTHFPIQHTIVYFGQAYNVFPQKDTQPERMEHWTHSHLTFMACTCWQGR